MSGFRFLSLPVELQAAVFEQEGSWTLARVCRTSRHFNRIATLLLYRVAVAKNRRQLLCLFRTLATVPLPRPFVRGVV
ncbi:hypothetical protein B0T26DRAFT_749123 [Lasiosphaeria miniovina]|uniref:F-box domain-containing protein n=1 Tax=Lasiosphaeria miniovina TaxID=1954250 RepID=A0AA40ATA4_9PEZI|nr:uncharacterized protein B0T26DRAFT_749123 [Lasiosphaeria miniovina]KAK0721622.1 hypothetical protein B0T26DRAFT_749123 [Lasiosphaeria miniovina]